MRYALLVCAVLVVALLLWRRQHPTPAPSTPAMVTNVPATNARPLALSSSFSPRAFVATNDESALDDPLEQAHKQALALTHELVKAANAHDFDPTVQQFINHSNRGRLTFVGISTPTHYVEVGANVVMNFISSYDSDRTPRGKEKWNQLTGKWTEQEAIAETRGILRRIGATRTLAQGTVPVYEVFQMPVTNSIGKVVELTPFAEVFLKTPGGDLVAQAQYRMEPDGPRLVRWWHWPKP